MCSSHVLSVAADTAGPGWDRGGSAPARTRIGPHPCSADRTPKPFRASVRAMGGPRAARTEPPNPLEVVSALWAAPLVSPGEGRIAGDRGGGRGSVPAMVALPEPVRVIGDAANGSVSRRDLITG